MAKLAVTATQHHDPLTQRENRVQTTCSWVYQVDVVAVQFLSYLITIGEPLSPKPTFSSHGFPGTEAPYHLLVNKHFPLAHKPLCNSDILQLHRFQSNNQHQTYNPNWKRYDIRFSDPTHAR